MVKSTKRRKICDIDIRCYFCGRKFKWQSRALKPLDLTDVYFCSAKCVSSYIRSLDNGKLGLWIDSGVVKPMKSELMTAGDGLYYSHRLNSCFRSCFEIKVAEYLVFKEKFKVYYESYFLESGRKIYVPDFFIVGHDVFIEAKGRWDKRSIVKVGDAIKKLGKNRVLVFPAFYARYFNGCNGSNRGKS